MLLGESYLSVPRHSLAGHDSIRMLPTYTGIYDDISNLIVDEVTDRVGEFIRSRLAVKTAFAP